MTLSVAIVGLSLRYPGFCGPAAFFDACRTPRSRLRKAHPDTVRPYLQDHPRGLRHPYRINNDLYGSIREMSWIDSRRFRVPPSDIEGDPSPFLCLQVASEALTDFQGSRPDNCIPRARTGVVIGRGDHPHRGLWSGLQGGSGFELIRDLLLERQDLFTKQQIDKLIDTLLERMLPFPNPSIAASLVSNVISGLVANRLDLQGPNSLVDAACTSAIVAVQQAIRSLDSCETDLMLVGACQATMSIPIIQMFSMLGAISFNDIQPFSHHVEGTLLSEGVGFVVLKRLEDAQRDNDRIYAVIRGLGLASDGNDSSILAPSSRGQILAMRNTYNSMHNISPSDIGFLEAHATGINLGDDTELTSILEVFRPQERKRPLALGALKSLIGHSIPASGMAALIRAVYAVSFGVYPVTRCNQPDDSLLTIRNGIFLPSAMSPWYESPMVPRRAAINCFGFGGINGHLVIEQASITADDHLLRCSGVISGGKSYTSDSNVALLPLPDDRHRCSTVSPLFIVCLSFADEQELITVLTQALDALPDMATGTNRCRHFIASPTRPNIYRLALVRRSLEDLTTDLKKLRASPETHHEWSRLVPNTVPKLAVMIPGESLIPFGHLSQLSHYFPSFKNLLEFVDRSSHDRSVLADCIHPAWSHLLSEADVQLLRATANQHDNATKILFAVAIAYTGLLRFMGVEPSVFVGHSTGEINALMLAGGLDCSEPRDVQLILRAFNDLYADTTYIDTLEQGTVALVAGVDDDHIAELINLNEGIHLVSDNSPSHRLIYSSTLCLEDLSSLVGQYGGFVLPTQLNRAYHTPLFASGARVMRTFYEQLPLAPLHSTVYSCCSAEPYSSPTSEQVDLLTRQWVEPVRFRQALLNMYRDGFRCFIELNASKTLLGFAEATFYRYDDVHLFSTGSSTDVGAIDSLANALVNLWLQGHQVKWDRWDTMFLFPANLSLSHIKRPVNAQSISHELHRFSSDDLMAAWNPTLSEAGDSPSATDTCRRNRFQSDLASESDPPLVHELDSVTPSQPTSLHQDTMRQFLSSITKNTRTTLENL